MSVNTWYNLVVCCDIPNSKTYYYLNGSLVNTKTTTAYYTANQSITLTFGSKDTTTDNFIGYMDEIRIYGGVLNSTRVSNIYYTLSI
jgi:hypothetical protein